MLWDCRKGLRNGNDGRNDEQGQAAVTGPARPKSEAGDDIGRFVSKGSAFFKLKSGGTPRDFHFLMLPKMTMLAFSASVEPLRIANQLTVKCPYRWYR